MIAYSNFLECHYVSFSWISLIVTRLPFVLEILLMLLGIRGAWVSVPKEKARFIPVLVEQQFNFHHAAPEYVMMNRWLPENEGT